MRLIIPYLLPFLFILLAIDNTLSQTTKTDSLLQRIRTDKEDTNKVKDLYRLCNQYRLTGDYETGLKYGEQALALAKNLNFKNGIASSYNNMGIIYMYQNNFSDAMQCYQTALEVYKENNNLPGATNTYGNMSGIYMYLGNYPEALKINFSVLKIHEANHDTQRVASTNNNIGQLYLNQKKYNEAINYFSLALKLYQSINDKEGIAITYNNTGLVYMNRRQYQEALHYFNMALKTYEETDNTYGIASAYNNIGIINDELKNYPDALTNYFASLKMQEDIGNDDGIAAALINIGIIDIKLHKTQDAKTHLMRALDIGTKTGNIQRIADSYSHLAILESSINNYKGAFEHYQKYIIYRDSLINEETKQKALQSSMQYEFDKKEEATKHKTDIIVANLETQNKLNKQKQFFLLIFVTVFAILVFIVLVFARRAYNNKKKYSEVLLKENEHKELLLREVHHRVNNSLQIISSLLSIQADSTDSAQIKEYLLKTENRIQAMSTMHHLLHLGNSKLEVNIHQYLGEIIDFYKNLLEAKPGINLIIEIPSVNFHTKTALPLALLLNELLTNAIKYAFPDNKGDIHISLKQVAGTAAWCLKFSDNGVGFKHAETKNNSTGLGLNLVKLMARQIGGKLKINTNNGTSFELIFDVNSD